MNTDKISDEKLSELVAKACGIPITPEKEYVDYDSRSVTAVPAHFKPYATSADSVLPLLNVRDWNAWTQGDDRRVFVGIYPKKGEGSYTPSLAPTFARAACLALLKAHGVTIE